MKVNELRVGNWLFDSSDEQKYFQIQQICKDANGFVGYFIVWRNGSFKSSLNGGMIEPIPLTPEILEKCGFKKDNYSQFGGYLISIGDGEEIRIIKNKSHGWHFPLNGYKRPKTNFLHQLQNLYFSLTGEELNVQL